MSKEKQCECCHEWWYDSNVKENLCPNCYDYFKQLKRQLEEKEKQIDIISRDNNSYKYNIDEQKRIIDDFAKQLKEKDNYHLRYELAGADETIADLRQQLSEKQNTIDEINKEFVQSIHDWKALCAEKDKEIERLKERLSVFDNFKDNYGYTNYDDSEILEDLQSRAFQAEDDTQVVNELLQFFNIFDENELVDKVKEPQTQLAIQELEKVKDYICDCTYIKEPDYTNVRRKIDQQIKELKGEKDVED